MFSAWNPGESANERVVNAKLPNNAGGGLTKTLKRLIFIGVRWHQAVRPGSWWIRGE
jgi:hypothetical protein